MAYTPANVNAWYQAVQFRDGPTATVESYVSLLNSGTFTPAQVQTAIINDTYTAVNVNSVIRLYQGAFNRVPDQAGQNYWADVMGATPDAQKPAQLQSIANGFANSTEFLSVYGVNGSSPINAAVLTAFYQNILQRSPDTAGYTYWLNSGQTTAQVLNAFAQSAEFTVSSQTPITAYQQAEIAGTAATSGPLWQYGGQPVGTAFDLTTNIDTVTSKYTVVNGTLDQAGGAGNTTWQLADQVNPATGSTLNATILTNNGTTSSGYVTTGVSKAYFKPVDQNVAATTAGFSVGGLAGLTQAWIKGATVTNPTGTYDTFTLQDVAQTTTVGISGGSSLQNVTATYNSSAFTGSDKSVALALDGASANVVTLGGALTKVNVSTGGNASKIASLAASGNALTDVVVSGSGDIQIDATSGWSGAATKYLFDASGNSGKVTITADASSKLTAKGGSGKADTINLNIGSSVTTGMAISGFETATLLATASSTLATNLLSDVTTLAARGSTTDYTASTLTLTQVAAGTKLNYVGTGKAETQYFNAVDYQLATSTGTSDVVDVAIGNAGVATSSTQTANIGLITAANIETVTIGVSDFAKIAGNGINIGAAKTLTLTGAAEWGTGTFTGGADLATINAGGYSGKLTLGSLGSVSGNLTYTGSTGIDTLTTVAQGATNKTQTFNLGTGADVITFVSPAQATGTLNINGEAGDDVITFATANVTTSGAININGGEGTDTFLFSGDFNAGVSTVTAASFQNIEKINFQQTNKGAVLAATVSSGYAETVVVTDVSGGQTNTINLAVGAGGSVSAANYTFLGWTSGTDVFKLTGSTGAETLTNNPSVVSTLTGLAGADTLNFGSIHATGTTADQGSGASGTFAVPGTNTISTVTFDVIQNSVDNDKLNVTTFNAGTAFATTANTGNDLTTITLTNNKLSVVKGTYTASSNTFVGSAAGTDMLAIYDTDASAATAYEAVVVVGQAAVTSIANDGVITL